jgi:hypothetical protein
MACPADPVVEWLLKNNPAIRWRVCRHLLDCAGANGSCQTYTKGRYHFLMKQPGEPSRRNTLRSIRVLRWWGSGDHCQ